jgi:hypothetical protein
MMYTLYHQARPSLAGIDGNAGLTYYTKLLIRRATPFDAAGLLFSIIKPPHHYIGSKQGIYLSMA